MLVLYRAHNPSVTRKQVVHIGASDARERAVLDMLFGSGNPTTWWLGLSTTQPNDDGTGFTEPVGAGYARVTVTNNATNFPPATTVAGETKKANGTKLTFPNPTGNWGTSSLGHYGWFTASTGGTPDFTNPVNSAITVKAGLTPVEFDVGTLAMSVD